MLRAAILAASPHNTQPWLFKVSDAQIELYDDTKRYPGALDPYLREQHIGLGCALESLMLAAAANGFSATATIVPGRLQLFPTSFGPQLVARVQFANGSRVQSELYNAIPHRHTNRNPYDVKRSVPPDTLDALTRLNNEADVKIFLFTSGAQRNQVVEMISEANRAVYANPQVEQGSAQWIRWTWSDVQKYKDGLTIDSDGAPPLANAAFEFMPSGWLRRVAASGNGDAYAELLRATPVFGLIAVRDRYDQEQSLRAGRIWQRLHLWLTAHGIAARPVNEQIELVDQERWLDKEPHALRRLAELTGDATWQRRSCFVWVTRSVPRLPAREGRWSKLFSELPGFLNAVDERDLGQVFHHGILQ